MKSGKNDRIRRIFNMSYTDDYIDGSGWEYYPKLTTYGSKSKCGYCGFYGEHQGTCPRIKSIEYFPNGTIKKVEFKDKI